MFIYKITNSYDWTNYPLLREFSYIGNLSLDQLALEILFYALRQNMELSFDTAFSIAYSIVPRKQYTYQAI